MNLPQRIARISVAPLTGVPTVSVAPSGAVIADLKIKRGGRFTLVDHAMSRTGRGPVGFLIVDGPIDDEIVHRGGVPKQGASSRNVAVGMDTWAGWPLAPIPQQKSKDCVDPSEIFT